MAERNGNGHKSLESWIWDAACSIRGAQEAAKYKDFILPFIFTKRLCDVIDDQLNRIAQKLGFRAKAFKLVAMAQNVIHRLSDKISETLTGYLRDMFTLRDNDVLFNWRNSANLIGKTTVSVLSFINS